MSNDTMRDALLAIMRAADAAKEPCGMDPESPAAIRNGAFATIALMAAQGLGMVSGPALAAPAPINQCAETCERARLCATCARDIAAPAPRINAQFRTDDTGVIGTQGVPVKNIEQEDDGSWTITLDYWPEPQPEQPHETMDGIAASRYKVSRDSGSMLGPWAVRAGDGDQILYHGSKSDCEAVARRLTGAFLDGGFVALKLRAPSAEHLHSRVVDALRDALSVCMSVSVSRDRRVVREGSTMFLQTAEWCQWAEHEVGPKVRAAYEAVCAATTKTQAPSVAPSNPAGWQPIETAPKDGTLFLCWVSAMRYGETDEGQQYQQDVSQVDFCQWRTQADIPGCGWFDPCCGQIGDSQDVTHWMPLPAAPEGKQP